MSNANQASARSAAPNQAASQAAPPTFAETVASMAQTISQEFPNLAAVTNALATALRAAPDTIESRTGAEMLFDGVRSVGECLRTAGDIRTNSLSGASLPSAADLADLRAQSETAHIEAVALQSGVASIVTDLPGGLGLKATVNAALTLLAGKIRESETLSTLALVNKETERCAVDAGSAPQVVRALHALSAAGPVDLTTITPSVTGSFTTSTGQAISLEVSKNEQHQAVLTLKSSTGLEVKMLLDAQGLIEDASNPDHARVTQALNERLEKRLHQILSGFQATASDAARADAMGKESAWGLLNSDAARIAIGLGCKVTELSNGEIKDQSITGLDLSNVKFNNFSLINNIAPHLNLSGSVFSGTYEVKGNRCNGARLDGVVLEDGLGGSRNVFTGNDFHGPGASAINLSINNTKFGGNNFVHVPMLGLQATSLIEAASSDLGIGPSALLFSPIKSAAALAARIAVRDQFKDMIFSANQMDGLAQDVFSKKQIAQDKGYSGFRAKMQEASRDMTHDDMLAALKSPFLGTHSPTALSPGATPTAGEVKLTVTSHDGRSSVNVTSYDNSRTSALDDDEQIGTKKRGNIAVMARILERLTPNIYSTQAAVYSNPDDNQMRCIL